MDDFLRHGVCRSRIELDCCAWTSFSLTDVSRSILHRMVTIVFDRSLINFQTAVSIFTSCKLSEFAVIKVVVACQLLSLKYSVFAPRCAVSDFCSDGIYYCDSTYKYTHKHTRPIAVTESLKWSIISEWIMFATVVVATDRIAAAAQVDQPPTSEVSSPCSEFVLNSRGAR